MNSISPGFIDTKLTRKNIPQDQINKLEERIPLGTLGTPEDIADAIAFLISEKARYITGTNLTIDGGFMAGGFLRMTEEFAIDGINLKAELNPVKATSGSFNVQSVPYPYSIEWLDNMTNPSTIINADESAIVLIDGRIRKLWFEELRSDVPIFEINATEANKTVYSAIEFAEFMESIGTTKIQHGVCCRWWHYAGHRSFCLCDV